MKRKDSGQSLLGYFFLLNLCFLILQLIFISHQAENFVTAIPLPWQTYGEIALTLAVHLTLCLALAIVQWILLLGVVKRSKHYFTSDTWLLIIWFLSTTLILSANAYYFPLSRFSKMLSPPVPPFVFAWVLIMSLSLCIALCINSLLTLKSIRMLCAACALVAFALKGFESLNPQNNLTYNRTQPNIIIIGIDSLSPDNMNDQNMPFVLDLLQNSTQFTDTISPLARTYPAWVSILTGLYPLHHQGAENLIPKHHVNAKASIAWQLQKQGYSTLFATDDRRFNSIDKEFGFQQIVGPKLGVNDVILGAFNDFPLSNLIINFKISAWLFPYNYINRASFHSYYPATFSRLLEQTLIADKAQAPIFLAVHFTLPHWPYAWAETLPEDLDNEYSLLGRNKLYQAALHRVDQQVGSFIDFLKQHQYLENSMLILLSDHGEALYSPNSRSTNLNNYRGKQPSPLDHYFKHNTATDLDKSAGHGSDLLSPKQYHSVLGFYLYQQGIKTSLKTQIHRRVALIDLAPTILEFAKLTPLHAIDGLSLFQAIMNPNRPLPERYFYLESGMFPNQLISQKKAMKIGKLFYRVNPDTSELEIREDKLSFFDRQKLYGIIYGDWIFVLYPNGKSYIPVIQNIKNGEWSDTWNSSFTTRSPEKELNARMRQFYREKII